MKKLLTILLAATTVMSATACGGNSINSSQSGGGEIVIGADYYEKVGERAVADENAEDAFYETFSGSLNNSLWYLLDGAWHNTEPGYEHNGVRSRNVYLVEDGQESYLALMGRGRYYKDETSLSYGESKPEGAALLSQKSYGPGRYEIRMKAHPREGAVSTMWTYMMRGNEAQCQHEIDIELGGTTKGSQYKHAWFTSWVTHTDKDSHAVDVSDDLLLNDGQWHTYTFDWYTSYNGTNDGRIDFFIDGKFYVAITTNVPYYAMPLWVGVWFPPVWAGNSAFDSDYMYVDYVRHIPFTNQYCEVVNYVASYSKTLPADANVQKLTACPRVNKIANGGFEYTSSQTSSSALGWNLNSTSKGTARVVEGGRQGKAIQLESNGGEVYLYQTITNVYGGYTYNISANIKGEGYIMLRQTTLSGEKKTIKLDAVSSDDWQQISDTFTAMDNCYAVEVYLVAKSGNVLFDDIYMEYMR